LRGVLQEIHDAGAELVVVGNGTAEMARAFAEDTQLTTPIYTDPSRRSYALAGFKRGMLATLSLRGLGHAARAVKGGFRQGPTQGDPWQLGGVLVVRKGGDIVYAHRDREAGDVAPTGEVLEALRSIAPGAG
jgi:AhpC/TSA antioxidant enzyme